MSTFTKFPTKDRLMIFPKIKNGRWACDGRLAFFCAASTMTNMELDIEAAVYDRVKGDLIKSYEGIPDFTFVTNRVAACTTKATLHTFNGGMLMVRFDNRYPEEIRGDNYVVSFSLENGETKHLYLPEKVLEYIKTFVSGVIGIQVCQESGTIAFVAEDADVGTSDVTLGTCNIIGVYNAQAPIYDVNTIL